MDPMVSIVVATYRRQETLIRALRSLATQTYNHIEIVLVDDNDQAEWNQKVERIADDFGAEFPEISLQRIVLHPNKGSAKARNAGIEAAHGEYVTFLDDDDVYLPDKVKRQVGDMIAADADYSLTDLYLYNDNGKQIDKRIRSHITATDKEFLFKYHVKHHLTGTDSLMFKRSYLLSIGLFGDIDMGDEFYLMEKAIAAGGKFCYSAGCEIMAYVHDGVDGLSGGHSKIEGEQVLYKHKQKYFDRLDAATRRYVKMRHYAVLAFTGMKMNKPLFVLKNGIVSFFSSPIGCIKLLVGRKI